MKVERKAEHAVGEDSARAATGKSLSEWFALMDGFGGLAKGRRELGQFLVVEHKLDPWWSATVNCEYELARGAREKDGHARGYTICATKTINATPAACCAAFETAAELDRWFGPGHELQMSDSGFWRNADGNRASVRKFNAGKTIKLIWEDDELSFPTPVEIKFPPSGTKTTVTVTIDRLQTRAEADGYRKAWGEALNRLKAVLEA